MKLGVQVGLGPGHNVLDGDPGPLSQKGGGGPQFSAHICCGLMTAWIEMPLGMEVGLGPGHIVLDGEPVGTQRPRTSPSPLFGACLLWPNGRPSQQLLSSC